MSVSEELIVHLHETFLQKSICQKSQDKLGKFDFLTGNRSQETRPTYACTTSIVECDTELTRLDSRRLD